MNLITFLTSDISSVNPKSEMKGQSHQFALIQWLQKTVQKFFIEIFMESIISASKTLQ